MMMNVIQSELPQNVKIGKGCIISHNCQIICEVGEIVIGDYTIIEDGCYIRNNKLKRLTIGSFNIIEAACRIENSNIGDCNVLEVRTQIESECEIQNNCRFGIQSRVPPKQLIADYSRVYHPFNLSQVPEQDMKQHKEEVQELCVLYIQTNEKQKK